MQDWIKYELQSQNRSEDTVAFHVAFYEYSLKYTDVQYDGNYFYKNTRIVQVDGNNFILKLRNPDSFMSEIASIPKILQDCFTKNYCRFCDFQGATAEQCKFRLHWTHDGMPHTGCAFTCFYVPDNDVSLVQHYWKLMELEYELQK